MIAKDLFLPKIARREEFPSMALKVRTGAKGQPTDVAQERETVRLTSSPVQAGVAVRRVVTVRGFRTNRRARVLRLTEHKRGERTIDHAVLDDLLASEPKG